MLSWMPCCWTTLTKAVPVNWLPWSVFRIVGRPQSRIAASSASRQKSVVRLFERRHAKTRRVAQSSTAAK
jgi:hypothetical protein